MFLSQLGLVCRALVIGLYFKNLIKLASMVQYNIVFGISQAVCSFSLLILLASIIDIFWKILGLLIRLFQLFESK
jgi:hypothetical protein